MNNKQWRTAAHLAYFPYKILIFVPFLAVSTFFFGSLAVIILQFFSPKTVSEVCGATWSRLNSYVTPMFVSVFGKNNIDPRQSYVIVSNHQSQYDIFVIYGWLGVDFKWVMKKELRKIPFLGTACDKLGHIYIDRSNREAALSSLAEARTRITDGTCVMFFPEGTRQEGGRLGEFKKGAFKMAFDLQIPILPVTIVNTDNILPPKSLSLLPGRAGLVIHEPVNLDNYSEENIDLLINDVKNRIQAGLDEYRGRF